MILYSILRNKIGLKIRIFKINMMDKMSFLFLIVRLNFILYKISYMHSLFIMIKGKEGFRHTWFHHERDVEGCTISRTPELRKRILLSSHQVLFLILRWDERPPRERLSHRGGEGTLLMVYIASRNPSSTHHRSRLLIDKTSSTRVMSLTS